MEPATEQQYLDVKLGELRLEIEKVRSEMNRLHAEMFKWMMSMFAGLYAVVILGYFLKH